jgi:hypothetical protein
VASKLTRARRAWTGAALSVAISGCGGSSPVAPPAPAPVPSPTPLPRVTFSLDAPADHYLFSTPLARLSAGQSLELTFKPLRINHSPDEQFAHTVEVWLWPVGATSETYGDSGIALSVAWSDSDWFVSSYTPEGRWRQTSHRFQIPIGDQRTVRVVRRVDGAAEFFLEESSVLTLPDPEPVRLVLARVVGSGAEFSYTPLSSASPGSLYDQRRFGARPCEQCLPRPHR